VLMQSRATISIVVRSALFHLVVSVGLAGCFLLMPLIALGPRSKVKACVHAAVRAYFWLLKRICGLSYECRGFHRIPDGPVLFASKHLSKWEAVALPVLLDGPAVVTRRESLYFPLYRAVIRRMGHLPISRQTTLVAAEALIRAARNCIAEGRSVMIFPEGTRTLSTLPFAAPDYRHGVVALYRTLGVPCVPIAVNAGLFWPRNTLLRYPGTVIAEVLPAIPPGLDGTEFLAALTHEIETNSERLVREGLAAAPAVTGCAPPRGPEAPGETCR